MFAGVQRAFAEQAARPDLAACVSSGLFDMAIEGLTAFTTAGVDRLGDTDHFALYMCLGIPRNCRAMPGCEAKIRSVATALAFCLENSLDTCKAIGYTAQASAVQVCCGTFGRDDGGEFTFAQQHIDMLLTRWRNLVRADEDAKMQKPSADTIKALDLCISGANTPLLLCNREFIPYLVDALLPRSEPSACGDAGGPQDLGAVAPHRMFRAAGGVCTSM